MRCPYCGSTRLLVDEERGMIVCMECGAVVEEGLVDLTGGVYRRDVEEQLHIPRRGPSYNPASSLIRVVDRKGRREDVRVVGRLVETMNEGFLDDLQRAYREVSELMPRKSVRLRLALAHALIEYRRGKYPLLSVIAARYGVNIETLRRSFRRLVLEARGAATISV